MFQITYAQKMHLCASHARQATKYDLEIADWLENHGVDVESISDGDGTSFEKLLYGNDVTDGLCRHIEGIEVKTDRKSSNAL